MFFMPDDSVPQVPDGRDVGGRLGVDSTGKRRPKLLLVCSPGGHLLQMFSLSTAVWSQFDHVWVSLKKSDSESLLAAEQVYWGYAPTNRNLPNLLRNFVLAVYLLWRIRPTCIVSTGAGLAVPFLLLGRLFGARTVYIESFARTDALSLTGRIVAPFVNHFLVQASTLETKYTRARYLGTIY